MPKRDRQRRVRSSSKHPLRRLLLIAVLGVFAVAGVAVGGAAAWVAHIEHGVGNIKHMTPRILGQTSEIYASNGALIGDMNSDSVRESLTQSQQPQLLREATVAVEDRRFFHHGGVDYYGLLRAAVKDVFEGGGIQGASTLTMQLVKNIYMSKSLVTADSLRYKVIQAKLADELEQEHSKDWILTQYLNDIDYGAVGGRSAFGVQAASKMYFDKDVGQLDLAQVALLAGLPQAPTSYNPFVYPAAARQRRSEVLDAMVQAGYITQKQAQLANASALQVTANDNYSQDPHPFIFEYVKAQLVNALGESVVDAGGLKVYTTINLQDQAYANAALKANEGYSSDPAAALASIDPSTGDILAIAQNQGYGDGTDQTMVNYATDAARQTGSAFKPFVLMTLIHDYDGDPAKTYYNSSTLAAGWLPSVPTWTVHNAETGSMGVISVKTATTYSVNTVFAQLGVDVGVAKFEATAHAMGITTKLYGYPSEAIGGLRTGVSPLQMADAYATLADGGTHHTATVLAKVVLPNGKTLDLGTPSGTQVFTAGEAYEGTSVLKTVLTQSGATGTAAYYGCPAAGKTGTTSNYTDAWFVGYTPQLSTAVWVGYPTESESMTDVNGLGPGYGGTLAAPIWREYMEKAAGGDCSDFTQPTTYWTGKQFAGAHSATSGYNYGTTTNSYQNTSTGTGTSTSATAQTSTSSAGAGNSGATTKSGSGSGSSIGGGSSGSGSNSGGSGL